MRPLALVAAGCVQPIDEPVAALVRTKDPRVWVDLTLRSDHADYLEYIADRDSLLLSHALEAVLDEVAQRLSQVPQRRPNRKRRVHVSIAKSRLLLVDLLVVKWGIKRSQVVMRLVDMARDQAA